MVNLLVHPIHELTTKLCYKLIIIKWHVVVPLKFFFFFLILTKKKKVSCCEDKVFTSNNWMSVLANMGKYHNDKCIHLSKKWKRRNMIIVSIKKKKKKNDNVWLSILESQYVLCGCQFKRPTCCTWHSLYVQNHSSLRQLQSKSWRDNLRLKFFLPY